MAACMRCGEHWIPDSLAASRPGEAGACLICLHPGDQAQEDTQLDLDEMANPPGQGDTWQELSDRAMAGVHAEIADATRRTLPDTTIGVTLSHEAIEETPNIVGFAPGFGDPFPDPFAQAVGRVNRELTRAVMGDGERREMRIDATPEEVQGDRWWLADQASQLRDRAERQRRNAEAAEGTEWEESAAERAERELTGTNGRGPALVGGVGIAGPRIRSTVRYDVCLHLRPLTEHCSECHAQLGSDDAAETVAPENRDHVTIKGDALCIHGRQVLHGVSCSECSHSTPGDRVVHRSWVYGAQIEIVVQEGSILMAKATDDELQVLEDHLTEACRPDEAAKIMAVRRMGPLLERVARGRVFDDGQPLSRGMGILREIQQIAKALYPDDAATILAAHDEMSRTVRGDAPPGHFSGDRDYPLRAPR